MGKVEASHDYTQEAAQHAEHSEARAEQTAVIDTRKSRVDMYRERGQQVKEKAKKKTGGFLAKLAGLAGSFGKGTWSATKAAGRGVAESVKAAGRGIKKGAETFGDYSTIAIGATAEAKDATIEKAVAAKQATVEGTKAAARWTKEKGVAGYEATKAGAKKTGRAVKTGAAMTAGAAAGLAVGAGHLAMEGGRRVAGKSAEIYNDAKEGAQSLWNRGVEAKNRLVGRVSDVYGTFRDKINGMLAQRAAERASMRAANLQRVEKQLLETLYEVSADRAVAETQAAQRLAEFQKYLKNVEPEPSPEDRPPIELKDEDIDFPPSQEDMDEVEAHLLSEDEEESNH